MKIPKRAPPVTPEYRKMIEDLHKESETFHNRETMKCPKCGSEMDELDGSYHPYVRYCRVCPYGEKVKTDEK